MTRESQEFINFFKKNLLILLVPALLFAGIAYLVTSFQPVRYQQTRLFELNYTNENFNQKVQEADEIVTLVRSPNLQTQFPLAQDMDWTVFKPGPVVISITTSDESGQGAFKNLISISHFIESKYDVKVIGQDIYTVHRPNQWFYTVLSFSVGFFVGLLFSLVRSYLRHF